MFTQRGRDSNPRLTLLPATAFKAVPIGHSGTPPGAGVTLARSTGPLSILASLQGGEAGRLDAPLRLDDPSSPLRAVADGDPPRQQSDPEPEDARVERRQCDVRGKGAR